MTQETKICQNCKNRFTIEPEDFVFYDKISSHTKTFGGGQAVLPPTWCPECRHQRRMNFRNERSLQHNVCGLCKKKIISVFAEDTSCTVYCQECWRSDKWEPLEYGRSSSHLLGCVSLHSKQYCILNKQYTKEEYEKLVPRIIEHMNEMPYTDSRGRVYRYGEFFPPELSLFSYNETIAQEYFPLTKERSRKTRVLLERS